MKTLNQATSLSPCTEENEETDERCSRGVVCFDFHRGGKLRCASQACNTPEIWHATSRATDARGSGGVPTFLRPRYVSEPQELEVALAGVPFDGGTTYRAGARFGPRQVREPSAILPPGNPVLQASPRAKHRTADYGDLAVHPLSAEDTFHRTATGIAPRLAADARCVGVGGDHSISLPLLRAVVEEHGPVSLMQFEAHCDLCEEYFGSKHSHRTPPDDSGESTFLLAANLPSELLDIV